MIDGPSGVTPTIARLALDAYAQRYQVLANNIANVDTAGFRPLKLNFEQQLSALQSAVVSGSATGGELLDLAAGVHPFVEPADSTGASDQAARLDDQMTQLTENTLQYEALLTAMDQLGSINRLALNGGVG